MTSITDSYVDSLALNVGAMKNGRDLARKGGFPKLCKTEDGTLIFGECKGSGKDPYLCSADFVKPESPVFRCSCPSRQFPCKHILGLLYAYAGGGSSFRTAAVPEDIADKREKAEKREDKKKETEAAAERGETPAPAARRTNKAALAKKIAAQLEGIGLLEKLLRQIARNGLGGLDAKTLRMLEDQAKQLGNHYIPGVQSAFRDFLLPFGAAGEREPVYTGALDKLTALHALAKRSRDYLSARLDNPELPMDADSAIEEWIGHAWQLAELRERRLVVPNAELLQLAFHSYEDHARAEHVDEGFWIRLDGGGIVAVRSYRPFRAVKHMKQEDTVQPVVRTKELFLYPGDMNPRARWEEAAFREPEDRDYAGIRTMAVRSYPEAVKLVKNQIKNPLADKTPVMLLHVAKAVQAGDTIAIEDDQGKRIALGDCGRLRTKTTELLPLLKTEHLRGQAMLVMFEHDWDTGRLIAQPLCVLTDRERVRLLY